MKKKPSSQTAFMGILVTATDSSIKAGKTDPQRKTRFSSLNEKIREALKDIMMNGLIRRTIIDSPSYTGANIIRKLQKAASTVFEIIVYSYKRIGKKLVSKSRTLNVEIPNIAPMPA